MIPYLKLLVRQRIAAWNPASHKNAGKGLSRTLGRYAAFCLGVLSLYGMLVAAEYFLFWAFAQLNEPETMLALTGALCALLTVVASFFYIFSELFFSRDMAFVSALPISSRQLLTAKLIRVWLGEALIALAICLPVTILYGVHRAMGPLYYAGALLLIPFMPMVPIALVTALSFLLIRISALWKRREALTIVMSMLFLGGIMWLQMSLSMSAKDDMGAVLLQMISRRQQFLDRIAGLYPPIRWFVAAMVGGGLSGALQGLAFLGVNMGVLAAVIALLGGEYQRLAIRQEETLTRLNASARKRDLRYTARTPLVALYRRELREIFTVPIYATNCLAGALMFPVLAAVMMLSAGKAGSELSMLPVLLGFAPKALIAAIATALFAFTTSTNMAVSTSVSREGKRHEFYRTLPVKPQTQLLAKLLMGLTLNVICALPMAILGMVMLPAFWQPISTGLLASLLFSTATTLLALMVDVNHPRFLWKTETEAIKQNGIAALSMFGTMAFIAACGGAYYGLTALGLSLNNALLALSLAALVADGLLFRRLMGSTSKHYILQEVLN